MATDAGGRGGGVGVLLAVGVGAALVLLVTGGFLLYVLVRPWAATVESEAVAVASEVEATETPVVVRKPLGVVYRASFAERVDGNWSHTLISTSKEGGRRYLGPIKSEDPLTFAMDDLPAHAFVRVKMTLFTMRSWNGNNTYWGPDLWTAELGDGRVLLRTTFGNCGFFRDNNEQSYPDLYPFPSHAAWTGSSEHGTLGWMQSWGGPDRTFSTDSVYEIEWMFPHTESTLEFIMHSRIMPPKDKFFGVEAFSVELLDKGLPLEADTFESLWDDLASEDAVKANVARWQLIASGEACVPMLAEGLKGGEGKESEKARRNRVRHVLRVVGSKAAMEVEKGMGAYEFAERKKVVGEL